MAWIDQRVAMRSSRAAALGALPPSLQWHFSPDDAQALQANVLGHVTTPADLDYPMVRQVFSRAYEKFPEIIVRCAVPSDVEQALQFAHDHDLVTTCRSGGHSTAGFSVNGGMVIDLGGLDSITVDRSAGTLTVGAGATFDRINSTMDSYGVHVPGGSCDGVALGGFVQGGGYGYTSLMFGMNSDQAVSARIMTAEHGIVECDAHHHPELFWALRGGGACGSFGVLLDVTYRTAELGALTGFAIRWTLEHAGAVMAELQRSYTGTAAPAGLGFQNTVGFVAGERVMLCLGMYDGGSAACREALGPALAVAEHQIVMSPSRLGYTDAIGFVESQFAPGIPNVAIHTPTVADSRYVAADIGTEGWEAIVGLIGRAPDQVTFLGIEPYGGPITAVDPDATAFVHRQPGFDVYVWVFWTNDDERSAALAFLDDYRTVMGEWGDDRAYQNYPSADNEHYLDMYYGSNLDRLQQVKLAWDPTNRFRYGQTIPLPTPASASSGS
jgi:FAD/FMN-containing dehydrogenase